MPNTVVVIGAAGAGKKAVVQGGRVVGHSVSDGLAAAHWRTHWPITTKYYTATVAFTILPAGAGPEDAGVRALLDGCDGILCVADAHAPLAATEALLNAWAPVVDELSPGSLMFVANVKDTELGDDSPAFDAVRDVWQDWCLDHSFELVAANPAHPLRGGETRDKSGVPRVIEHYHSTMWSDMQMGGAPKAAAATGELESKAEPPAAPAAGNRVVVLGGASAGKHTLAAAVAKCLGAAAGSTDVDVDGVSVEVITAPLRTKYYTTQVELACVAGVHSVKESGVAKLLQGSCGVILVLDASAADYTYVLEDWAAAFPSPTEHPVQILAANKSDVAAPAALSAMRSACTDWCLCHAFELVVTSATSSSAGAEAEDDLSRNKVGIARIVEYLHSTVWPVMQYTSASRPAAAATFVNATAATATAAATGTATAATEEGDAEERLRAAGFIDDTHVADSEFERLFAMMHSAKDQFSRLPDDQRRAAAANMVMQLMKLVDGDDGGNDGFYDEESEDDE